MKINLKLILSFLLFLNCCLVQGQTSMQPGKLDVIHFKNGKTIEGIIIKQEFGTVSIRVADSITQQEKTRIYQQNDIQKIQKRTVTSAISDSIPAFKEGKINKGRNPQPIDAINSPSSDVQNLLTPDLPQQNIVVNQIVQADAPIPMPTMPDGPITIDGNKSANPDDYFDPFAVPRPKRREQIWNRDIRGFRAFSDYAYIQGMGLDKNHRFEFMQSIGFQFNPIFYTGLGVGYDFTLNNRDASVPFFVNQRINFLDEYTTPFWDVKVGYSIGEGKGIYFSTSVGASFTKNGGRAFNVGLVYSLQKTKYFDWENEEKKKRIPFYPTYHGLALKITYEFGFGR